MLARPNHLLLCLLLCSCSRGEEPPRRAQQGAPVQRAPEAPVPAAAPATPPEPPAPEPLPELLGTKQINAAYDANEVSADDRFKGKRVRIVLCPRCPGGAGSHAPRGRVGHLDG